MSVNKNAPIAAGVAAAYLKSLGVVRSVDYTRTLIRSEKLVATLAGCEKYVAEHTSKAGKASSGAVWFRVKMTRAAAAEVGLVTGVEEIEDPKAARDARTAATLADGEAKLAELGITL